MDGKHSVHIIGKDGKGVRSEPVVKLELIVIGIVVGAPVIG